MAMLTHGETMEALGLQCSEEAKYYLRLVRRQRTPDSAFELLATTQAIIEMTR